MAHFQIENLTFQYPNASRPSLDGVNLTIEKGAYVVLCGRSGSGKTTLLRHLKPVLTPYGKRSGSISFDGFPLEQVSQRDQAAKIGFVMQNPDDQIVTDKVWHELAFGLESLGTDPKAMRLRVAEMASYFGLQGWFHLDVATLSGGQKQLLNLASIMAMQPEVLILDEPTSQLDPIAASDFLNTVRKINIELGTTILITEHRLEDIYHSADRVVVMDGGKILADGGPRQVGRQLWQQKHEMFAALPTPLRVFYEAQGAGDCPLTVREGRNWLTESFENRAVSIAEPAAEPAVTECKVPAIKVREAWFRYEKDSPDILRGVSFSVPQGSLFAIVGGNGSGKSTTLKTLCGICRPYRGSVEVFGKPLKSYKAGQLYQNCLAMLPQDPKSLFVKKTLRADLAEMCHNREAILEMAESCGIAGLLDSHPYDLSGGEQQRAALAKVLLTNPRLLLLDEPTKGLDSFFKGKFAQILKGLTEKGITVILVSHDVEFCAEYADLVSMFFDGQVITTDTPRRFFGQNSFYTTAANRMSRCVFRNAVTARDVAALYRANLEEKA
ncbi:MAG: ATP-binding cassette domain-containing protein [Eubacteriales bacterium]|nr:ATP-binding cassette domain-containing protein [Eubacteriales bacterium]